MISYYRDGNGDFVAVSDLKTENGLVGRGPAGRSRTVCNRTFTEDELAHMTPVSPWEIPPQWQQVLGIDGIWKAGKEESGRCQTDFLAWLILVVVLLVLMAVLVTYFRVT